MGPVHLTGLAGLVGLGGQHGAGTVALALFIGDVARAFAAAAVSVIGIPFAVYYYYFIRTSLFAQTWVLGDQTAIGSLRASARLTRRRWWRTLGFSALIDVIAILSGPLLGVLLLLPTSRSLTVIDVTGSIVYALVVPYAAAALTLLLPRPAGARGARTRRAHSERSDPMITLSPTKQYRQGCSCEPPGTTSSGAARSPQPGSLASSS